MRGELVLCGSRVRTWTHAHGCCVVRTTSEAMRTGQLDGARGRDLRRERASDAPTPRSASLLLLLLPHTTQRAGLSPLFDCRLAAPDPHHTRARSHPARPPWPRSAPPRPLASPCPQSRPRSPRTRASTAVGLPPSDPTTRPNTASRASSPGTPRPSRSSAAPPSSSRPSPSASSSPSSRTRPRPRPRPRRPPTRSTSTAPSRRTARAGTRTACSFDRFASSWRTGAPRPDSEADREWACNPFEANGRLHVDLADPRKTVWTPFDARCPPSNLLAALYRPPGDTEPLIPPHPLGGGGGVDSKGSKSGREFLPWFRNRTVVLQGDSIDRFHLKDFCEFVGGRLELVTVDHPACPAPYLVADADSERREWEQKWANRPDDGQALTQPWVCDIEEYGTTIVNVFTWGLEGAEEFFRTERWYYPPGASPLSPSPSRGIADSCFPPAARWLDRTEAITVPLLPLLAKHLDRPQIEHPDMIVVNSGYWDLRKYTEGGSSSLFLALALSFSSSSPLTPIPSPARPQRISSPPASSRARTPRTRPSRTRPSRPSASRRGSARRARRSSTPRARSAAGRARPRTGRRSSGARCTTRRGTTMRPFRCVLFHSTLSLSLPFGEQDADSSPLAARRPARLARAQSPLGPARLAGPSLDIVLAPHVLLDLLLIRTAALAPLGRAPRARGPRARAPPARRRLGQDHARAGAPVQGLAAPAAGAGELGVGQCHAVRVRRASLSLLPSFLPSFPSRSLRSPATTSPSPAPCTLADSTPFSLARRLKRAVEGVDR